MSDPIFQPTEDIQYPEWQADVRAVMMEIDPVKVKEKIAAAEQAIAKRIRQLTTPDDDPERRAMREELGRMKEGLAELMKQHPNIEK